MTDLGLSAADWKAMLSAAATMAVGQGIAWYVKRRLQSQRDSATVTVEEIRDGAKMRSELREMLESTQRRLDQMEKELSACRLSEIRARAAYLDLRRFAVIIREQCVHFQVLWARQVGFGEGGKPHEVLGLAPIPELPPSPWKDEL